MNRVDVVPLNPITRVRIPSACPLGGSLAGGFLAARSRRQRGFTLHFAAGAGATVFG